MELSDAMEKIPSDTTRDRSRDLPTTTPPQALEVFNMPVEKANFKYNCKDQKFTYWATPWT
jgi:hypothetical protein